MSDRVSRAAIRAESSSTADSDTTSQGTTKLEPNKTKAELAQTEQIQAELAQAKQAEVEVVAAEATVDDTETAELVETVEAMEGIGSSVSAAGAASSAKETGENKVGSAATATAAAAIASGEASQVARDVGDAGKKAVGSVGSEAAANTAVAETEAREKAAKPTVWQEIFSRRMGVCVVTGFASGMPLFVLINLLAAYMRKEGLDLKVIGAFSLMMIPYTWKFLWAPLVDRFELFHLGRRKDWIILSQVVLILSIGAMGFFSPKDSIGIIALLAMVVAFSSATQDIVLDAYRREFLPVNELGLGNAVFVNAYRVAGLVPGGISLIMADYVSWTVVFNFTAACLLPCLVLSIFLHEENNASAPRTLKEAVVEPFREFITRRGVGAAIFTVCFVFLYKIGDSMALALATPFYMDLGYDLTTIGIVAKNVGLWSTVGGGLLGGVFMLKLGINRALWIFGLIQMVTILGYVALAHLGQSGTPSVWLLALVLVGEYGGGGLGTAAFVAFIAKETNPRYTATQLALLSSFSAIPRTFCNAVTGYLVEGLGWENFFILCTLLAIPGMLLLFKVAPWKQSDSQGF